MAIGEITPVTIPQVHHPLRCGHSQSVLVFRARDFPLAGRRSSGSTGQYLPLVTGSIFCHSGRASSENRAISNGGKKREVEKLWREFFADPSEWQDNRIDKTHPKFPDFTHKQTQEGLWLNSKWMPPWVEPKLALLPPGTLGVTIFSWNQRLSRCVKAGQYEKTMQILQQMQREGIDSDKFTFVPVLNACANLGALEDGRRIHTLIIEQGFGADIYVGSSLVDMYAKCGSIGDAERVFQEMPTRNVVTWNTMILGYVKCGEGKKALELYGQMQEDGVDPNHITFLAALNACASLEVLEEGQCIHKQIIRKGFGGDIHVGSSLVDMYGKCGSIGDAERAFNEMPTRNVVSWNALIQGYVKCGEGQKALELYGRMDWDGVDPNPVTFVTILKACASVAALEEGRSAHEEIIRRGYESNVYVQSSLVDMYAKCGSINDAERVFKEMPSKDAVAWNAMLTGYCWHGYAKEALEHFKQMCESEVVCDITFVSLLSACSHGGLVDEGQEVLKSMSAAYNISPTEVHYACIVDLLGRAGRLHEAEDMVRSMPVEAGVTVWRALLGACRVHGNVEMGEHIAKEVVDLDPESAGGYVLMSNIYAAVGQ